MSPLFTIAFNFSTLSLCPIISSKEAGFLIGEVSYGENKLSAFGVEEFATDGVIALYLIQKNDTFTRALRIVKMRNTSHLTKLFPMDITEKGIVVYPNVELFAEI